MYAHILAGVDGSNQGKHALPHSAGEGLLLGSVANGGALGSRVPVLLVH
jgi:nucleotide-binding universal stress UspA family protein